MNRRLLISLALWFAATPLEAGLHYSGEEYAELPSQWRGFLLDQRLLRMIALEPGGKIVASPGRKQYDAEAGKLLDAAKTRELTPDELADLGALLIRLGRGEEAVTVLREGQRLHPRHFRIAANLGTAWQQQGNLEQASIALQQAVKLAPGKWQRAEELHLKLVRGRARDPKATGLDDLFGIKFVNDKGEYEAGKLAAAQRKQLPGAAVALTQQLALWLPADGKLLWQLGELAAAHGDVRTAASIMDGCVTEFALGDKELRQHRQLNREAADALARAAADNVKVVHDEAHTLKPKSNRPLATRFDRVVLPAIKPDGINPLPWQVINETTLDRQYRPQFAKYLKELDGKQVEMEGFMQPLGEGDDIAAFMLIEYPTGCWYCEAPGITGIFLIELPSGKTTRNTRDAVKIVGKLSLNATDPENFLYNVTGAKVVSE
ncbi:MAG: DUF3299 domain-containing protein [Gemmataceae bacterium]